MDTEDEGIDQPVRFVFYDSFIHSFTHQIFIAKLLCANHCYPCWRFQQSEQDRKDPCFHDIYVLLGETDDKDGKI